MITQFSQVLNTQKLCVGAGIYPALFVRATGHAECGQRVCKISFFFARPNLSANLTGRDKPCPYGEHKAATGLRK